MKTFEEHIREAVDFRLGGCQKKGFEQTKLKTFAELKKGDIVYLFDNVDRKKSLWSYTFEKIIRDGNNAWIDLSGGAEWDCEASDLNLSTIVDDHYGYCLSTDLDEMYDALEKQLDIINARNIKIEEH